MNLTIDAITFSASSGITPPVFPMHVPDASGLMPLVLPDALARRLASSENDTQATIPQTNPDPESVLRFQKIMATPIAGIPRSAIEMPDSTAVKDQPQQPMHQRQRPQHIQPRFFGFDCVHFRPPVICPI